MARIWRKAALRAACIALGWTFVSTASAQEYPNRTIRIIMPLGPGGIGDVYLRD
jgi:tripartite-type tricarboxylate transporter receptor subunit TctC